MNNVFICYPTCSTCVKAKKWLMENEIEVKTRNIKTDKLSLKELKGILTKFKVPIKKLFNTSGILYKEMKLKDKLKTLSEEDALELLASDGMLVKRPLFLYKNRIFIGFKEAEWEREI